MSFNDTQIQLLQKLYNDASLGLITEKNDVISWYDYLKSNGETGNTLSKIHEFLKRLEVNQVLTKRSSDISFVAEDSPEQFQIDLVYKPTSWFYYGLKYIFVVWMYSVKKQIWYHKRTENKQQQQHVFKKVLNDLGKPKTIYSDQGSEFKNENFPNLLDKRNIQKIFALDNAAFVESLIKL